jgi:hypothetical protein
MLERLIRYCESQDEYIKAINPVTEVKKRGRPKK